MMDEWRDRGLEEYTINRTLCGTGHGFFTCGKGDIP